MKVLTSALALVAVFSATPAQAAPAQAPRNDRLTIGVQPASATAPDLRPHFTYALDTKGVVTDHLAVFNYSTAPVTVRLYARDALTSRSGALDVQPRDAKPTDVGAWIALASPSLTLKPRSRAIVPFQLGVPYNASPGDHTGAVVASLTTKSPGAEGRTVDVENRIGLRVYLRVGGEITRRLAVSGLGAKWGGGRSPIGRGPATVSFDLRNTGNVRLGAKAKVVLRNAFGRTVGTRVLDDPMVLLPGSSVPMSVTFAGVLGTVRMSASVTVEPLRLEGDTGAALPPVTGRAGFWAIPWVLLLGAACLALAAAYAARRSRRSAAAKHRAEPARGRRRAPRRVPVGVYAGAVVVLAVVVSFGGVAFGATTGPWQATLAPGKGADDTPIELLTSGGCPAPATNIVARVYGHGLPSDGYNVVGNTSANVRPDAPFEVPFAVTLRDVARDQPTVPTLTGKYRVDVICRTARDPRPLGIYRASLTFSAPTAWRADRPVTVAKGPTEPAPVGGGDAPGAAPNPGASGAPAAPGAVPGGTAGSGVAAGSAAPDTGSLATEASSAGLDSRWLLVLLGAVAVPAAFVAGRRRGATSPEGKSRS